MAEEKAAPSSEGHEGRRGEVGKKGGIVYVEMRPGDRNGSD